jgi:hypothetical protein
LLHELFYLAALIGLFYAMGSRWHRLLRVPQRLITKGQRLSQGAWQSIPGRHISLTEPVQQRPTAKRAAH